MCYIMNINGKTFKIRKILPKDNRHLAELIRYNLIRYTEERMAEAGFSSSYLETHKNLEAAIHIYEKCGYERIACPEKAVHSAMTHFYLKRLL